MLLLGVHVLLVVGGFLLLSVIPARFSSNEKREAPFVLWFGSPKGKEGGVKVVDDPVKDKGEKDQHSLLQRVSAWLEHTLAGLFAPPPARDIDARYRFHVDMTQQLAAASAKTYESIAVSTEDLEPPLYQTEEGLSEGKEQPRRHLPRQPSRSSIFAGPPPSPPAGARLWRQGSTRLSEASTGRAEAVSLRTSRAGSGLVPGRVVTKDDFIRAASRRKAMEVKAEKREALAQEDVSYENLGDDEIRMYEYLEFVRELLDGLGIKKICQKSGRVVSRTLYITPDMTVVFWNAAGTFKRLTTKSSIHVENIQEVLQGIHGSRSVTAKSTPERDALCVSIRCRDDKWLVLEAKSEAMRQRVFLGFSHLGQEKEEQDAAAAAAAAPAEPTLPEQGAESHTHVLSTAYEAEVSIERGVEQGGGEQDIYEEKAHPPPLPSEEALLKTELLSIRASYENQISGGDQEEAAQDQVQDASNLLDDVGAAEDKQPFQGEEQEEEKEAQEGEEHHEEERPLPADDEVDIDNLSDDPELSRE
ncbi:hypothetical protein PHYSODRAFT_477925 [Phytophthora sojae]|uniref:Uncharacterized protein n=1 Tax=Phytophthora sojae (strain P6497) TaxID=1094619 RepID=G4YES7_PHYSP|nr:hypothetical protein PHYSODRAFT_477925 [Phytophthora sojae]EGZ26921.1 hypothetical protein PHYSODRAFT_477925 [Phytophthora sojae]|eukprot:XP_009514196.1 hypothetical protein PHYSODRAFT_477925 [Phytophthora sojae]